MATTFNEAFEISLAMIDEMQSDGIISEDTKDEYEQKALRMATSLQSELMIVGDLYSTYEISKNLIEPNIGSFEMLKHTDDDIMKESTEVANAYYFEVDSPCTVYIEDYNGVWITLSTIAVPSTVKSFTAYKGIITPSVGATISRIRFSGNYYYNIQNYALFTEKFATVDRIPDYRAWVKYDMPLDFKSVDTIIYESYPDNYVYGASYRWEGKKSLYLSYYSVGNIRIQYKPVPLPITTATQILQIDDITARTVLPNGLAAVILVSENPSLANYFQSRFEELKNEAKLNRPKAFFQDITDEYGSRGGRNG